MSARNKRWRFRMPVIPVCTSTDFWHDVMHGARPSAAKLLYSQSEAAKVEGAIRTLAQFFVAVSEARLWLGPDACNAPVSRRPTLPPKRPSPPEDPSRALPPHPAALEESECHPEE